jgi:DNA-binding CsgD family transcriptional regulator
MSMPLSAAETGRLARALTALASPLEYPTVEEWRADIHCSAGSLLRADNVGFILPAPVVVAPLSGEDNAPAGEPCAPTVARHTLRAMVPITAPGLLNPMAGLLFWRNTPTKTRFGQRERRLLSLLLPALKAGAGTAVRFGRRGAGTIAALGDLNQAALVCDRSGSIVHQTARLDAELAADPERERILEDMQTIARSLVAMDQQDCSGRVEGVTFTGLVVTDRARYATHGALLEPDAPLAERAVVVGLERRSPVPLGMAELRTRFGLSMAESRVAQALAAGSPNDVIATSLHISPHTVRRHTEAVLAKVGVRTRAELVPRLLG